MPGFLVLGSTAGGDGPIVVAEGGSDTRHGLSSATATFSGSSQHFCTRDRNFLVVAGVFMDGIVTIGELRLCL